MCVYICVGACRWLQRSKQNVRPLAFRDVDGCKPQSEVGAENSFQSYSLTIIESSLQSYNQPTL